jgi:hypothetical protein
MARLREREQRSQCPDNGREVRDGGEMGDWMRVVSQHSIRYYGAVRKRIGGEREVRER